MQGWEAGVGPAALELHKQGFFRWAGEIPCAFEGTISATRTLFFLEKKVKFRSSNYCQVLYMYVILKQGVSFTLSWAVLRTA